MAVTLDFGTGETATRDDGIYGIYNKFVGHFDFATGSTLYKVAFRVSVEALNDSTIIYEKDYDAVTRAGGYKGSFNPVQPLQNLFFGSEYTGATESTSIKAYSGVRIKAGLVSATSASLAPTFGGYDTDDTLYFYNGYEDGQLNVNCYREPRWYDTEPYLLPKVKKILYLQEDDIELLSMPSFLNIYPEVADGTNLDSLVTAFYDSSNSLLSTSTIDLRSRPDLDGVGYWNININFAFPSETLYSKTYCQWDSGEGLVDSESITIYRQECNPKNPLFRLLWSNRYGGEEAENFTLKHDKKIVIKRGKKIQSSGVDYAAESFDDIGNINDPNLKEFGTSYYTEWKLRTDFITQAQIDALKEAYISSRVLMVDSDGNVNPVLVQNSNYEVLQVENGLQKVEVSVRLANFEPNQI